MPEESEYHRTYKTPTELKALSPDPQQSAGLSSVKMALAVEPSFTHKRKSAGHERKVTFTTDYTEHGSPTKEDDKGMKFRASFRRVNLYPPTEYQLQYTLKTPVQDSPLLTAENMLYNSSHPTDIPAERSAPAPVSNADENESESRPIESSRRLHTAADGHWEERPRRRQRVKSRAPDPTTSGPPPIMSTQPPPLRGKSRDVQTVIPPQQRVKSRAPDPTTSGPLPIMSTQPPPLRGKSRDVQTVIPPQQRVKSRAPDPVPEDSDPPLAVTLPRTSYQPGGRSRGAQQDDTPPADSLPKSRSPKKKHSHSHHHRKSGKRSSPKKRPLVRFSSEYRAQFKPWPVEQVKDKHGDKEVSAGMPPVLADHSDDPRLLRHSPLPVNKQSFMPSSRWGSEYSSNYLSPTKFEFASGAWQGAPHPDLFYKPTFDGVDSSDDSEVPPPPKQSWCDQLNDLRKKADDYKCRAQGTYFSREYLQRLEEEQQDLFERASTSTSVTSSGSPSTSGSSRSTGDVRVEDIESEEEERITPPKVGAFKKRMQKVPAYNHRARRGQLQSTNDIANGDLPASPLEEAFEDEVRSHTDESKRLSSPSPHEDCIPQFQGRIATPILQKEPSVPPQRHHLDLTTPSDGGLLLSPLKLPYPPTSPKYRKDMRSTAPIHPSPKPSRFESVGTRLVLPKTDPVQSTTHHLSKPMPTTSKTTVPPCSQLPRCPPGNSSSPKLTTAGATRKLQFGHSGPSALEQSCETCGAWLRSSSARLPQTHPSYAARQASRGKSAPTRVPSHKPAVHTSLTQPYQSLSGMLPKPVYNATTRPNHTYATHLAEFKRPTRDIDECSLSSVSLSNCSVASDLLRRAQERRDHFWTQPQEA